MKVSSSNGNREARSRSDIRRTYSNRSSSKDEGSSSRSKSQSTRSSRSKRAKDMASASSSTSDEECTQTPWLELLPKGKKYIGVENRLHHEILAYLAYMEETPKERKAREIVMAGIRRVVHGRFYNAEVNVFGSSATGLGLPTSDIDIALSIPRIPEVKQALFQLAAKFKSSGLASSVLVNHRAHVPIIMLTTREEYGSLSVDIGINNPLGTEGVEVMKGYLARMPALRPLLLLMKGFLRQRKLNDASKGGMGSYALACLCIHFLKVNPSKRPQEFIDKPMEAESLGFLLTDFMFYYGLGFPYTTSYISASEGKILPKPQESESLSIRCLIDPENDISKSVQKVDAFLNVFKEAYATILQLTTVDENMLGQLVSVSKKFIAHRDLISGVDGAGRRDAHHTRTHTHTHTPHTHTHTQAQAQAQVQAPRHHSLPSRPPSGNTPRAPRTWAPNPSSRPYAPMGLRP